MLLVLKIAEKSYASVKERVMSVIHEYTLPEKEIKPEAKRSLEISNAGGKSEISEMYSIDYFERYYNASCVILEMEVSYSVKYKMVDYICTIDDSRVGVSVARAMGFPTSDNFTLESAYRLLHKKLYGLIVARNSIDKKQSFYKSILHIWCQNRNIAEYIQQAYQNMDDYDLDVKGVVILLLTVNSDESIYKNSFAAKSE